MQRGREPDAFSSLDPLVELVTSGTGWSGDLLGLMLGLIGELGTDGPVIVGFDDLQWGDAGTWDLFEHLARNLLDERVVLVGSYRTDEVSRDPVLRRRAAELSRRGSSPASMPELIEGLRAAHFSTDVQGHSSLAQLSAEDGSLYAIPMDDLCAKQPAFLVEKAKKRGGFSPRQRQLEEKLPTPPSIRTESLRPRNLLVRWFRDKDSGEYRYEIDVVE